MLIGMVGMWGMAYGASAQSGGKKTPAPTQKTVKLNINKASVQDLTRLPGIGPRTAERIVTYRKEHGPFKRIEEIMNVRGIGRKKFERIKSMITVR